MKNLIIYTFLAIAGISNVFAQKDVEAKKILAEVSQKYRAYDAIKTDFTFTLNNQQAGIKDSQNGTLISRAKSNKYKVTIYEPGTTTVAQEIINDGKTQWTYLKKDNEVEVNVADNTGQGFNPAQIFTIYEHGYKYLYTGDEKLGGKVYLVIDLSPTDEKSSYFKIRLMIDKIKKQVFNALIFDKNGNRYSYTIRSFKPNVPAPDAFFTFDKSTHPGVEVVDLKQ